jgi:uncharacterized glyoxalase superfamily protein PhnB
MENILSNEKEMAMPANRPTVSSGVVYRDPRAAIAWLEKALGFETTMLIEDPSGGIAHSELRLGDSVIMVGTEWDENHKSPASLGGKNTQSLHIQIDSDVDAHCRQAKAAGADVFKEPETQFYGDCTYRCRDPEGHIWTVGQTVKVVSREDAEAASGLKITGWV